MTRIPVNSLPQGKFFKFWAELSDFLSAELQIPVLIAVLGVTPKSETGEKIPIYSEWRVDEAISTLDGRREAPGSGTDVELPACKA
ncbi:MAG TPA: hypothetical protein VFU50_10505, partial [Terriglobales bacterium]|nr:hypothetical protein [Terriglobales bacterium]